MEWRNGRSVRLGWLGMACGLLLAGQLALAQDAPDTPVAPAPVADSAPPAVPVPAAAAAAVKPALQRINLLEMLEAGGTIGYVIIALSIAMIALIFEHLLTIRRGVLMPGQLAENAHALLSQGQLKQAEQLCKTQPSFLAYVLTAGIAEAQLGYAAAEKAMEDASQQQAARLYRKIENLSVISTLAPMLGLLGTVWGMILAFMEFEVKANPQVAELAPGIYRALVTTLQGLSVAIPAIAAYSLFRNRVDELVAQSSLMAEHVFAGYRRFLLAKQSQAKARKDADGGA